MSPCDSRICALNLVSYHVMRPLIPSVKQDKCCFLRTGGREIKPNGQANLKAIQHGVGQGTSFQDREHLPAFQEILRKAKKSCSG